MGDTKPTTASSIKGSPIMSVTYPLYCKGKATGNIFKFTSLATAKCIVAGPNNRYAKINSISHGMQPHTNTDIWEVLNDLQIVALKITHKGIT